MEQELQDLVEQWGHEFEIQAVLESDDTTWVPLAEAERQAGVSRSTLRAWYRGGQIASRLMPGPHGLQRLVPLEAVLARAERSPRTGPRPAAPTPETTMPSIDEAAAVHEVMLRLAELAASAAAERAAAAEARADAAEQALHAALERAAAAEALLAFVNAQA